MILIKATVKKGEAIIWQKEESLTEKQSKKLTTVLENLNKESNQYIKSLKNKKNTQAEIEIRFDKHSTKSAQDLLKVSFV
jgi:hypothetical protein